MKTRNAAQFDHRLETLEARSLLSAGAPVQMPEANTHAANVLVADESFLNGASDSTGGGDFSDAEMYDFGSAGGTQPASAAGTQVQASYLDLDGGAVDQDPGHPMMNRTPADLSGVVTHDFGHAAPYNGAAPVITQNDAPVGDDSDPTVDDSIDAPVVTQPETTIATPPPALPQSPSAITVAAPSGQSSFVWLEIPGIEKAAKPGATPEQVVMVSTFIGH